MDEREVGSRLWDGEEEMNFHAQVDQHLYCEVHKVCSRRCGVRPILYDMY